MSIRKIEPKTDPEVMRMVEDLMKLAKGNRLDYLVVCSKVIGSNDTFAAFAGLDSISDADDCIAKLERMKFMIISE